MVILINSIRKGSPRSNLRASPYLSEMILLTQIRHTIYEALNSAVPFTVSDYKPGEIWEAEAKISESYTLQFTAYTDPYVGVGTRDFNVWQVEFKPTGQSVDKLGIDHGKKYGIVGTGGDAATIMATVIGMMDEFIVTAAPPQIRFTASEPVSHRGLASMIGYGRSSPHGSSPPGTPA